ncbi:MAG: PKD domain-containing protein, partial [Sphingobacteriia bacterium]
MIRLPFIFFLLLSLLASDLYGQNNCNQATQISLGAGNFGLGNFQSARVSLDGATLQPGEYLHSTQTSSGTDKKSIWYAFALPTARSLELVLSQDNNLIPQDAVGFTLYRSNTCSPMPGLQQITEARLTPLNKFGSSFNPCLLPGNYLVQVTSRQDVDDEVFVELRVGLPTILNAFDRPTTAQNMGVLSGGVTTTYDVGCQTIEDAAEVCAGLVNAGEYTQSTWHTFTTDAFVDGVSLELADVTVGIPSTRRCGYRLLQGAPTGTLTEVVPCTPLNFVGANNGLPPRVSANFICSLQPNTQYTVQIFYHRDEQFTARLNFFEIGSGVATGTNPLSLPAANSFGNLPTSLGGTTTTRTDNLSCDSRLSLTTSACRNTVMPVGGVDGYELSTWFRFRLTGDNNVTITALSAGSCTNNLRVRLYRSTTGYMTGCDPLAPADLTLFNQFNHSSAFTCIPAGFYMVQVLGDSADINWCGSHLGRAVQLSILGQQVEATSNFDLATAARIDNVNGGAALPVGVTIPATFDRFACNNTVLPAGDVCGAGNVKAIYRRIVIDQNGILTVGNGNWQRFTYRLYQGDASTAPQSAGMISGLVDQANCQALLHPMRVCVTPGTYTLVSFGDIGDVGIGDQPNFTLTAPIATFTDPNVPNDMGTITGGVVDAQLATWTCLDNPLTIAVRAPCNGATKQIYRVFRLTGPTFLSINSSHQFRLFSGDIRNGVGTLTPYADNFVGEWGCRGNQINTSPCAPLPAPGGWYTIVQYATGGTFTSPTYTNGLGGDIGSGATLRITVGGGLASAPGHRRPADACVANNGNALTWNQPGTDAVPTTGVLYTLCTEFFDCSNDLPFSAHPITGCTNFNRTAYYTFQLTQESYVNIRNIFHTHRVQVYVGNARTNPAILNAAPLQPCIQMSNIWPWYSYDAHDGIEICRAQPGEYTLVVFADDSHIGRVVQPRIYVDRVATSRFDHASAAYDFGVLPRNGLEYSGRVNDPEAANPVEEQHPTIVGRRASSDIFYCTTGAQPTDPSDRATEGGGGDDTKCEIGESQNPAGASVPYPMPINTVVYQDDARTQPFTRRNLWYTFVINGAGRVTVRVRNRTNGKMIQAPFTVYRSDVDGTLDFATVRANGQIDSTVAQGLTFVDNSFIHGSQWCNHGNLVRFERNPCTETGRVRYYVVVDNNGFNFVNSQVDVSVQHEGFDDPGLVHDFCDGSATGTLNASNMGVLTAGVTVGDQSSFACATRSTTDPNECGNRTLWYTFESTFSGRLRINYQIAPSNQILYNERDIQIYRADNCTQVNGTSRVPLQAVTATGQPWGEGCLNPGRYYVLLTGCNHTIEQVTPSVWLIPQAGDLCTSTDPAGDAVNVVVSPAIGQNAQSSEVVNIDCHTIGEAFGEDGSNMGCLFGPAQFKSTWFRITVNALEKIDLSFRLEEQTSVLPDRIRYRVLYGGCGALSAGPCNTNGLTEFTLNCMQQGDYYVQVVMPAAATGNITLTARTSPTQDQDCNPLNPLLPIANFTATGGCVGADIEFSNFSTQGTDIAYEWDFGVTPTVTSNDFNPVYAYTTPGTYNVTLTVTNTAAVPQVQASVTIPITIYLVPTGSITVVDPAPTGTEGTNPTCDVIIASAPYDFGSNSTNAQSWFWDFASGGTSTLENPTDIEFTQQGSNLITLVLTNGTCTETITHCVIAGLEPIYQGGPFDGSDEDVLSECVEPLVYQGGPFDGADVGLLSECVELIVYQGGPFDGAANFNNGPTLEDQGEALITTCPGDPVTLDLTLAAGAGTALSFSWSVNGTVISTNASITVSPMATTNYLGIVTFEYPGGCEATLTNTYTVYVAGNVPANAGADVSFCANGTVTLGSAAVAGYTYSWSPATGLSATNVAQPTATVSTTTTYTLTVTDPSLSGTCATSTDQVVVSILPLPVVTPGSDQEVCPSGTTTITATVSAGAGYEWFTLHPTTLAVTGTLGTASS